MGKILAPRLARCAAALAACGLLALSAPGVQAQYPAVWIGGSGDWLAKKPGDWTIVDFNSPWQFFPDNNSQSYFFATIPNGHVYLDTGAIPGGNGVPVNFLGVEVSTLVVGNGAELTLQNQGALSIEGISMVGGLLHNEGLIRITGTSVLSLPLLMPITGNGEIVLASEQSFLGGLAGVVTHGSDHTISGFGTVTVATVFNQGRLLADTPGKALTFIGGHLDNSGLLRAGARVAGSGEAGGELRINPLISMKNSGQVVAENGFVKIEDGALTNSGMIDAQALGTVSLQDLNIDNGSGLLRVRTGGAFALGGSNIIKSGQLEAEAGSWIAVASGVTELRSGISLTGLLKVEGGSVLFRDADMSMAQGRIELAAGVNATTGGTSNTFRGGVWQGSGRLSVITASFWDGVSSPITIDGPQIDLFKNTHRVAGTLVNNGRISLRNNSGFNTPLNLILVAGTELGGTGELVFAESHGGQVLLSAADPSFKLRNGPQHRILGSTGYGGTFTAELLNEGLLDSAGAIFQLWSASITNTGILRASAGQLQLTRGLGTAIANAGGRIESTAGGSVLFATNAISIAGGTLAGAGEFRNGGHLWLDGASTGALSLEGGTTLNTQNAVLHLIGSFVNDGKLELRDGTPWLSGNAQVLVHGEVSLGGSGMLVIAQGDENVIDKGSGDALLRIGSGQTLRTATAGTLKVDVVNAGRLEARGAGSSMYAPVSSIRNTGVLGAFDGATFNIGLGNAHTLIDNQGGRIEVGAGSVLSLGGGHPSVTGVTTILGGALAGAGRIDGYKYAALESLNIEAGATVRAGSGSNLYLRGSFVNDGTVELYDGTDWLSGNANLLIDGPVTFNGTGSILFAARNENVINKATGDALLTLGSGQSLRTIANTSGTVYVDLNNQGRFEARGMNSSLLAPVSSIRNTGIIGAYDGATFNIGLGNANTLIDNQGGRIEVGTGSVLSLGGSHPSVTGVTTILGGTLAGAGRIDGYKYAVLESLAIEAGATVRLLTGSNLYLRGSIVNDGTVELFDGTDWLSGNANLLVQGPVTVSGTGSILFAARNENVIDKSGSDALLTVASGQTMRTLANTSGTIKVDLNNQGRIEARGANASLYAPLDKIRNTGVIAALEGATFNIGRGDAHTLIDNQGGRIEVGAGSVLSLGGSHPSVIGITTILGGTLAGAGRIDGYKLAALESLSIESGATVRLGTGSNLFLRGTLVNDGAIQLYDGTNWLSGNGVLWVQGPVAVKGSGKLLIAFGDENVIDKTGSDSVLSLGSAQTLSTAAGTSGRVRANLANAGRVEARGAGSTLYLQLAAIGNTGTLAAAEGADLRIGPGNANTVIDNQGGRIEAASGSRVFFADAGHPANFGVTTVQGGVLAGTGTFFMQLARLSAGVHIAPGNSPGLLSFNGELQFDPLGALEIEIGGTAPGSGHDRVNVAGRAVLDGTLDLSLWGGFTPAAGDVFTILSAQSLGGAFDNVVNGRVSFAGGSFDVLMSGGEVKLGNFVAVPVPEPWTALLMTAGLLGLAARIRRAPASAPA